MNCSVIIYVWTRLHNFHIINGCSVCPKYR